MSKIVGMATQDLDSGKETSERERRADSSWPRRVARRAVPPFIVVLCLIGIWYLISYFAFSPEQRFLLPPPHQVVEVGFLNWSNFQPILSALWVTGSVALVAFGLSTVIGIRFAIAMSEAKWVENSFFPLALGIQTLPFLAIVPLVGFWFGYDFQSRVVVATIVSLFPITTNTLFGLKSVEPGHADLFRLHHATRLVRLWRLKLPGALPSIFYGLRISAGLCIIASIVTDFFIRSGSPGIGALLDLYSSNLESEQLLTSLFMTALLGIAIYLVISMIGRQVVGKWHSSYRESRGDE